MLRDPPHCSLQFAVEHQSLVGLQPFILQLIMAVGGEVLLKYSSHLIQQCLALVHLPCIHEINNPSPGGLRSRDVTHPLNNHRLKDDETLGVPLRLVNPLYLLVQCPHKPPTQK